MARTRPPGVELLETRTAPATYGIPWSNPGHLTLSFAPDGTPIAAHYNQLADLLDPPFGYDRTAWQREAVRALQTWAVHANLSIGLRADDGTPFGLPGRLQGERGFGDIRLAAHQMTPEVYSLAVPPDPFLSGTLAGDIFLNSAANLTPDNLFPILLHEAGHVLGLEHSDNPASPMYAHFNRITQLTEDDVLAVQALYGARAGDRHEPNNRRQDAAQISWRGILPLYLGLTPLVAYGDRTTPADVDYFWVEPPLLYTGPVTFRLQTAGLSFLAPHLAVYDASGRLLGRSESAGVFGGTVSVRIPAANPLGRYYVQVDGPADSLFGIGRYGLSVSFDDRRIIGDEFLADVLRGPLELLTRENDFDKLFLYPFQVLFNDDLGTNFSFATAERLDGVPGYRAQTRYEKLASLARGDVDFYRVRAAAETNVLTVTLAAPDYNGLVPAVSVFDAAEQYVPAQVLLNGNGTYTVQAAGLNPGADYFLVVGAPSRNSGAAGNYLLMADFGRTTAGLDELVAGTLDERRPQGEYSLYVGQSQLFQFLLSTGTAEPPGNAWVSMELRDVEGNVLFRLSAWAEESASASSLFLVPGEYRARFTAGAAGAPPALPYRLRGRSLTDPVGPVVDDSSMEPMYRWEQDPSLFQYPNGEITPAPYLWVAQD